MGLPSRFLTGLFCAALCAGLLAACNTTSGGATVSDSATTAATNTGSAPDTTATTTADNGGSSGGMFGNLFHKGNGPKGVVTVPSDDSVSPDVFLKAGYCPPVQIRPDTEALILYDRGHDGDADYVRYQASIGDIARECHAGAPDTLDLKVGIAGRIAAGPKGGAGNVAATLRIAVVRQHDNSVLFTKAYKVVAAIGAPDFSSPFAEVADDISVKLQPGDRDLIVFVGFDEGRPKPKPTG